MCKNKAISLLLALCLVFALAACGSNTPATEAPATEVPSTDAPSTSAPSSDAEYPTITLQAGTATTAISPYCQALEVFGEKLSEITGGAMTVEIFPDSQLGGEVDLIEGVAMGTVDMCVTSSSPVANYVTDFFTFDLPYLVTDLDHAHEVMDGELGRALLDQLTDVGVYGMALWDNGFRCLTNSDKPVYTLADVSGMKIRVMENDLQQAIWQALGAYPTPMSWGEVITALEQGTINGQENPLNAIYSSGVYEVQPYITLTNHVYTAGVCMMSQSLWDSFDENTKAAITEAMAYTTEWERNFVMEEDARMEEVLTEEGCQINEVDDITEWSDAVAGIYDEYADRVNQELVAALRGE